MKEVYALKVRIKFQKSGCLKFVGHLDIMRYFQKLIRRANIDIAYSEGFSPHQIMSFAAPLGVGITSDGEYLDIEVRSSLSSKESVEALNQASVEGIHICSYRKLSENTKNAMSIVAAADYDVAFREGKAPENWQEQLKKFYEQPSIVITKKTKKSEKEIDLKPLIYQLEVHDDKVHMRLCTGSTDNIKPELVMEAFYQSLGLEMPEFALLIHRKEIYANPATSHKKTSDTQAEHSTETAECKLVPLEDLGEDIE